MDWAARDVCHLIELSAHFNYNQAVSWIEFHFRSLLTWTFSTFQVQIKKYNLKTKQHCYCNPLWINKRIRKKNKAFMFACYFCLGEVFTSHMKKLIWKFGKLLVVANILVSGSTIWKQVKHAWIHALETQKWNSSSRHANCLKNIHN